CPQGNSYGDSIVRHYDLQNCQTRQDGVKDDGPTERSRNTTHGGCRARCGSRSALVKPRPHRTHLGTARNDFNEGRQGGRKPPTSRAMRESDRRHTEPPYSETTRTAR